jgi:hypothetical protein
VRKPVAIGTLAGLAIGFSACVSSHPKAASVEWHKARYLQAKGVDEHGRTPLARQSFYEGPGWCGGVPTKGQRAKLERKTRALEAKATKHYTALLELGYLAERAVIVTGPHSRAVVSALNSWNKPMVKARLGGVGTNLFIVVTAPESEVGRYEEFIRKADGPVYEDTVVGIDVP